VSVIAAMGGNAPPLAAKAATSSIPIVFNTGADPVASGLVPSLNRPGGNVTGVSFLVEQVGEKGLGLLHEIVPQVKTIGVLVNPRNSNVEAQRADARDAATAFGLRTEFVHAATSAELDTAFAALVERKAGALLVTGDPLFGTHMAHLVALAAHYRIPAMYYRREFPAAGGLMSYGTSATEAYGTAGEYVARVLKGAKPADLPVTQVVKFEFVINLKTAKALGIEVPAGLSARATVIFE
jgi:putative ABC transport system substrate-binding protein